MSIKQPILFVLMAVTVFGALPLFAQAQRSVSLEYRLPDEDKLDGYRSDGDFSYKRPGTPSTFEPWERFKRWWADLLKSVLGHAPSGHTLLQLFYILASLIIIWVVVKLVGAELNLGFKKSKNAGSLAHKITEENIQNIDFEKEMAAARSASQWRVLIRLQYLFLLKKLAGQGLISIREGKTNHDYLYELGDAELRKHFSSFSRIFEYTWYGHFEVSGAVLQEADRQFIHLQNRLKR